MKKETRKSTKQELPRRRSSSQFQESNVSSMSFSAIPRVTSQSGHDFFHMGTKRKSTTFFQPAQSEEEYNNIVPKNNKANSPKAHVIEKDSNEKFWRFFQKYRDHDSSSGQSSEQQFASISGTSRPPKNNQIIEDILVMEGVQADNEHPHTDELIVTQEKMISNNLKSSQVSKMATLETITKVIQLNIIPKNPLPNLNTAQNKKRFRTLNKAPPLLQKLIKQKQKLHFIEFQSMRSSESPKAQKYRVTRMTPLRYWLGEKVVYGKSGAKGMWVVEN